MTLGHIHSIESMGLVDGPGIRTVVFLQGCNLRCCFCHNPDTWTTEGKLTLSPEELVAKLVRFKPYYGTRGGVTFSGGEPLLQKDFLLESLKLCKAAGISTCLDSAGCGCGNYSEILKYTDLVLLDIKHYTADGYQKITGCPMEEINVFLKALDKEGTKLWIRHVVVPGLTDGNEHLQGLREYLKTLQNVERVELLPYHVLGVYKYKNLGIPYRLEGVPPMEPEKLEEWQRLMNEDLQRTDNKI